MNFETLPSFNCNYSALGWKIEVFVIREIGNVFLIGVKNGQDN